MKITKDERIVIELEGNEKNYIFKEDDIIMVKGDIYRIYKICIEAQSDRTFIKAELLCRESNIFITKYNSIVRAISYDESL